MRKEKDTIGEVDIPSDSLYGIQTVRARENFPIEKPFHIEWYRALGAVKLACYHTYRKYGVALQKKFAGCTIPFPIIEDHILDSLIWAAEEVMKGHHFDQFIVPAFCGGAGTSINMNVNEIISNLALTNSGRAPGDYHVIDPINHANVFQSTNDVIPTSLRIAVMELLGVLENRINLLRAKVEVVEKRHLNTIRVAYTQMQEAVPSSYGRLFSAYNEALSRDWWRVSKSFERIKVVNLGGSAVGTGITVPRYFIFEVVQALRDISGRPVTRSENLSDATSNLDPLVEVHAVIKAHAVNLEKMSSDIRILSSDLSVDNGFSIPARQLGSTIMPGKINPVIPEFVISCCHKVYSNDSLIASLAAQGCLELNPYLPIIGHEFIESIKCLIACNETLAKYLVPGIAIDETKAKERLLKSPSTATILVPYIGYRKASEVAAMIKKDGITILDANRNMNILSEEFLEYLLSASSLLSLGFVPTQIAEESESFKKDNDKTGGE
jgi:aspartate ammonia-lyase